MLAALTVSDKAGLVVAGAAAFGLVFAAVNAWLSIVNERKRTQPIVIAHGWHEPRPAGNTDYFGVGVYLTNEGDGPAFNVRFGVSFEGVLYPYMHEAEDPSAGSVQRVLRASERRPQEDDSWGVFVDASVLANSGGDRVAGCVYWARFENAQGMTWESRNPADRAARLDVRRIRVVGLRQRFEYRKRAAAGARQRAWKCSASPALPAEDQR
jgi:hypothetical protein